jgi:hypothetical protein
MEFKNTLEVLYAQAEEIRNMASKLETASEIRTIDLDLMLEKLRNIYDLILDLEATIPSGRTDEIKSSAGDVQPTLKPLSSNETIETSEDIAVEKETKAVTRKDHVKGKDDISQEQRKESVTQEKKYISDRFRGSKQTLHEEMAGRTKQEDISSQYKTRPINNIMGAIALNERFELMNQLFNGDKELFERTIEVMNTAGSFVDAYNYLQENFKWDMDNEYVQRLLELIRRKLIVRRDE